MTDDKWVESIVEEVEEREEIRSGIPAVIAGYYLNDGLYFDMEPLIDDDDWD